MIPHAGKALTAPQAGDGSADRARLNHCIAGLPRPRCRFVWGIQAAIVASLPWNCNIAGESEEYAAILWIPLQVAVGVKNPLAVSEHSNSGDP